MPIAMRPNTTLFVVPVWVLVLLGLRVLSESAFHRAPKSKIFHGAFLFFELFFFYNFFFH
jgi:hypothetical protein